MTFKIAETVQKLLRPGHRSTHPLPEDLKAQRAEHYRVLTRSSKAIQELRRLEAIVGDGSKG